MASQAKDGRPPGTLFELFSWPRRPTYGLCSSSSPTAVELLVIAGPDGFWATSRNAALELHGYAGRSSPDRPRAPTVGIATLPARPPGRPLTSRAARPRRRLAGSAPGRRTLPARPTTATSNVLMGDLPPRAAVNLPLPHRLPAGFR